MVEIQRHIVKRGKRRVFSRPFHTKDDSEAIAAWRSDLDRIRRVVEVRSLASTFCLTIVNILPPDRTRNRCKRPRCSSGHFGHPRNTLRPHSDVSTAGVPEYRPDVLRTGTVVPRIDHGSVHPHTILSDKAVGDHTAASDVRHRTTKSREEGGSRYRAVSIPLTCPSPSSSSSPLT